MTSSRALQSQSNSPRLSTYCSLSKFFKLRLHLRPFFRRLPSVLLPSPWRYPRDCVCALPLERERSPSLSSRDFALVPTSLACIVVTPVASSPTSSRTPRLFYQLSTHKLALLNLLNRGRQPASWNWCPAHPVGFSPVSYISYFIDPTHPPLPIILLPTEPLL